MSKKIRNLAIAGGSFAALAIIALLIFLLINWFGRSTVVTTPQSVVLTIPEGTPSDWAYGDVVLDEPQVSDFTSEDAWEDYEKNWKNPAWTGEYPEGYRVKTAEYDNEGWQTFYVPWVAGVLSIRYMAYDPELDLSSGSSDLEGGTLELTEESLKRILEDSGAQGAFEVSSTQAVGADVTTVWLLFDDNEGIPGLALSFAEGDGGLKEPEAYFEINEGWEIYASYDWVQSEQFESVEVLRSLYSDNLEMNE